MISSITIHLITLINYLSANDSQNYVFPKTHSHKSKCLLDISTCTCKRNLKVDKSITEFLIYNLLYKSISLSGFLVLVNGTDISARNLDVSLDSYFSDPHQPLHHQALSVLLYEDVSFQHPLGSYKTKVTTGHPVG